MATNKEKLEKVLTFSNSGKWLKAADIYLLDRFENGAETPADEIRLNELFEATRADFRVEFPDTLFGLGRLVQDGVGYIYWLKEPGNLQSKVSIEHYSHDSVLDMLKAAERLQENCLALEAKGFPVNGRTAICKMAQAAPADTPWLNAILRMYAFFSGNDRYLVILYSRVTGGVVVVENVNGKLTITHKDDAYTAFHFVQNQGLKATTMYDMNYEQFCQFFEAAGLTPSDLQEALTQEMPLEDVPF